MFLCIELIRYPQQTSPPPARERERDLNAPRLRVVVFVVGANDIGTKTPVRVFEDIVALCEGVHNATPSATILISELLPRARNRFNGNGYRQDFLEHWNYDAGVVNKLLREFASKVPWEPMSISSAEMVCI
ncbi:hypothetical protein DPMN_189996 [Dreissena polymorpha]|uniref:Uncharacterized protein n=1 Tax=Dreissena polymorpha TaxID=45954 RepID=A0A9D4IBB9_DREPO|nr:hypothetical protein DPMN_189996 [Dreissena polymorpha]